MQQKQELILCGAMKTNNTATQINVTEMQVRRRRNMLQRSKHIQEEAIANHYASCGTIALQLRVLCEERKFSGSSKLDDAILLLSGKIRRAHMNDFGIELEWNNES